jgi:hypothetical protein
MSKTLPSCTTKIATVKSIFSWMWAILKNPNSQGPNPKEVPGFKLQAGGLPPAPGKHQGLPITLLDLVIGISLDFGAWDLKL